MASLEECEGRLRVGQRVPFDGRDVDCIRQKEQSSRENGSRFLIESMSVELGKLRVIAPHLDTQFIIQKRKVNRVFVLGSSVSFSVLVGRLSEDIWFVKQTNVSLAAALGIWDLESEEIEQAWSVMTGRPIALTWMTSPS